MTKQAQATAMSAAFEAAGISRADMIFYSACLGYLRAGGTTVSGAEILRRAAAKLESEGHVTRADNGQHVTADASRTHEGAEGHTRIADKAIDQVPSAPSERNGAGQTGGADKAKAPVPRPVSASYLSAAREGAKVLAVTVLDTYRIRDGRPIGDVRFGELERLRSTNAMEAAVIRQIQRKFAHAAHDAKVRDLIKPDDLNRMMQTGAEVADAV